MQNEPFLCPIPLANINLPSQTNIPLQDSFLTKSLYSMLAVHVRTRNSKKVLPPLWNFGLWLDFHWDTIFRTFPPYPWNCCCCMNSMVRIFKQYVVTQWEIIPNFRNKISYFLNWLVFNIILNVRKSHCPKIYVNNYVLVFLYTWSLLRYIST